jgi:excisionase family DNA binding protein
MNATRVQPDALPPAATPSVSLERACELLHVSRRTLYYWIKSGRIRTKRTMLGSQRVLVESLLSRPGRCSFEASEDSFLLK